MLFLKLGSRFEAGVIGEEVFACCLFIKLPFILMLKGVSCILF